MDDDASTQSALKWSNADYMKNTGTDKVPQVQITRGENKGKLHDRPDNGKLPPHISKLECVADPNHQRKVLTREFFKLLERKVGERKTMTKMDVKRLGKNFSYSVRCLPDTGECNYVSRVEASLLHHFDIHTNCGDWCACKKQTEAMRKKKD